VMSDDLPERLDTPEFKAAWGRWLHWHDELGCPETLHGARKVKPYKSSVSRRRPLLTCDRIAESCGDVQAAIAAIDNSIRMRWRGIHEDRLWGTLPKSPSGQAGIEAFLENAG
jgi:hypothetical protein